ncbi:MAG: ABC transporter ATP-binding protein [Clostridiales bacterium]|nr:ABC transporter ATP-binding protein [Clostridiales bacterium]
MRKQNKQKNAEEPQKETQRTAARKLLRYLGRQKVLLALSVLCALLSVAGNLYLPILTGQAVDTMIGQGNVDFPALMHLLFLLMCVIIVTALFQWIMEMINNWVTYRVLARLRNDVMEKIQRLPLSYLDQRQPGDLVNRMINDADQMANGLLMGLSQLFTGVMTVLATIGMMFALNSTMALIVVLITPLSLFIAAFIGSRTYHMFWKQSTEQAEQTAFASELLQCQRVSKTLGYQTRAAERFDEINARLAKSSLQAVFYSSLTNPSTRFINNLVYAGVGISGAFFAILSENPVITVGELVTFLTYANQYSRPFNDITGVITEMQNALACAARIFTLLDQQDEIQDGKLIPQGTCRGNFVFSDVCFSYRPDRPLITDFQLQVKSGQTIAIVGPTGCGKTTLINLIMRFYDVQKGTISLDGLDTATLSRASLREQIGMVLQETWLMNGSVRDNIRFGRPDATDEEVQQAAKEALAHGFIMRLADGYDTVVGEGGTALSEGQKQLLCIARIMLTHPQIVILDEATSSIDTRTEMRIRRAFDRLTAGKTCFVVAHRLSTIQQADQIIVMRNGSIIEMGTHASLLAAHGFYETLYQSQFLHTDQEISGETQENTCVETHETTSGGV